MRKLILTIFSESEALWSKTNDIEVKLKFTPKGAFSMVMYFESRRLTSYPHLHKVSIAQFSWGLGALAEPWWDPGGIAPGSSEDTVI